VRQKILKAIARITPDGLIGMLLDHPRQKDETLRMKHRVSTGKCDIHIGINYAVKQLLYRYSLSTILIPRLRVMTPYTTVFAPRRVERGAKSYTINRSAILDIKYAYAIYG
jgi:hypothetical protein